MSEMEAFQAAVTAFLLFFAVGMTWVPENRKAAARPSNVKYRPVVSRLMSS